MSKDHTLRRSQLITTFGVGSICDLGEESFIAKGINSWGEAGHTIFFPPLHEEGITHFRIPPAANTDQDKPSRYRVPYFRFPQWLFCQKCRYLTRYGIDFEETGVGQCGECSARSLVPMRWVFACEKGHLSDVDWSWWIHASFGNTQCRSRNLEFRKTGRAGSLDSLSVKCKECPASGKVGNLLQIYQNISVAPEDSLGRELMTLWVKIAAKGRTKFCREETVMFITLIYSQL